MKTKELLNLKRDFFVIATMYSHVIYMYLAELGSGELAVGIVLTTLVTETLPTASRQHNLGEEGPLDGGYSI